MYNVLTDEIQANVLYKVIGEKSVIYDEITYNTDDTFRGIQGITTFEYTGSGTEFVTELTELYGTSLVFEQTIEDRAFPFEETGIEGMAIVFELNEAEKIVQEVTRLTGMSITLLDYPFYSYVINEERFSFKPD